MPQTTVLDDLRQKGLLLTNAMLTALACILLGCSVYFGGSTANGMAAVLLSLTVWAFYFADRRRFISRLVCGLGGIAVVILLVATFTGLGSMQLDFHMLYFAWLAMLVMLVDWRVILAAAGLTAVHHLGLNFLYPNLVFPDGANFLRVLLHAVAVVLQTGVLVWFTFRLERMLEALGQFGGTFRRIAERMDMTLTLISDEHTEVGKMGGAANLLLGKLRDVLGEVKGTCESLRETASALDDTNARVKARSGKQVEATQEIHSTLESSTEQIHAVAEHAHQADQDANLLRVTSTDMSAVMVKLQNDLNQINEVSELIRSFSDQTNLLALNASIEAARAGEAGRGFAVVANEVRTLAGNVGQSVTTITERVGSLQTNISSAVTGLEEIAHRVEAMSSNNRAINESLQTQVASTKEVTGTVRQFQQDLTHVVEEIEKSIQAASDVARQSEELAAKVAVFNL